MKQLWQKDTQEKICCAKSHPREYLLCKKVAQVGFLYKSAQLRLLQKVAELNFLQKK